MLHFLCKTRPQREGADNKAGGEGTSWIRGRGGGGKRKGVQFPICSSSALIWIRVSTTVSLRKAKEICKDYMDNNNDDDDDDDDRKHFNITRNQGTSTCQIIQSCKNTLGCVILFG